MEAIIFIIGIFVIVVSFTAGRVERNKERQQRESKLVLNAYNRGRDEALFDPKTVAEAHRYHTSR